MLFFAASNLVNKRKILCILLALSINSCAINSGRPQFNKENAGEEVEGSLAGNNVAAIKNFVDNCLEQTMSNGLSIIGSQGGYANIRGIPFITDDGFIGYGYFEGVDTLISLDGIGRELSAFIENHLPECMQDFEVFKQQGYSIMPGNLKAETIFTEDTTIVNLDWPLEISKGGAKNTVSDFSASADVRLRKIYNSVETIVNKQLEDPEYIDYSYLKSTGFLIIVQPVYDEVIVFAIADNESILFNNPYVFIFANKFKFSEFTTNIPPNSGFIPDLKAVVGSKFTYQVEASDIDKDKLTYSSPSNLFELDESSGLISFTPASDQAGNHTSIIEVEDADGLKDRSLIIIEVVENDEAEKEIK